MTVEHVEVLVEEPSMEAFLREVLPRVLGETSFQIYAHQCKQELLDRLPARLAGYASWIPESWRILVVVDRDDERCHKLKKRLETFAAFAGLRTRSVATTDKYAVVNRLAIEELEAWYFGDWDAVRAAYPRVPRGIPTKTKYRDPDGIQGGTWEAFERILVRSGYFEGGLRKIEAARSIGSHILPDRNTSRSFQVLLGALREMSAS